MSDEFEWCVMRDINVDEPHRGPMSEAKARQWVREWEGMAENSDAREGMFYVARRPVGSWQRVE